MPNIAQSPAQELDIQDLFLVEKLTPVSHPNSDFEEATYSAHNCIVWDSKPDRKEDPINWVELKTSAEIRNDRDMLKYERKLLKFWAQSFLLGVPKIVVGFRDQEGIVRRLEEVETANIPSTVKKSGRGTWDGNICINFAAAFLECKLPRPLPSRTAFGPNRHGFFFLILGLKTTIEEGGTWRLRKAEKSSVIEVFKVEETGTGDILSEAFLAWRTKT
jgi:RAT1-interacting protein